MFYKFYIFMIKKYFISLINKQNNSEKTIECFENQFILEAAEEQNIELPYSCRTGSCSTCIGKIVKGIADQSAQTFLDDKQIDQKFILLCCAYPMSDMQILTHEEENLY